MVGSKEPDERMMRESDSFFTRFLARSISTRITPQVAKTPITPMQVTLAGLVMGLLAAWQASQAEWINGLVAALLLEASHILDCVDGELARLTKRGNPFAAAMDPITDRIKDIAIIFASLVQGVNFSIFDWPNHVVYITAFFTVGIWTLYIYIVDAFLNPQRKKKAAPSAIYLGLYDLFIYGAIAFLIAGVFQYFFVFVLCFAAIGSVIQIYRLRNFSK